MKKSYFKEIQTTRWNRLLKFGTSALFCLVFMAMSINVQAQYNLVATGKTSGLCETEYSPTSRVMLGLSGSTQDSIHVLFKVKVEQIGGIYTTQYYQVGYVQNNLGGPITFGTYYEPGKYVAYLYASGNYIPTINAQNFATISHKGTKQTGEFWIIKAPVERALSFTGTEVDGDYKLEGTNAIYCNSGSITLTNPEYSPESTDPDPYGSQWNVTYTLLRNGTPYTTDLFGHTINPRTNVKKDTIVWSHLASGIYTVKAERTPCATITFPTPGKSIIVIPDATAIDVEVDPISNISSVTGTPVILPVHIVYPTITPAQADPSVNIDSRISTPGGFPANTTILNITYNGIDVLTGTYEMGGKNNVLLSDILGLENPGRLIDQSEHDIHWEITLKSETDAIIPTTIETITYRGTVTNTFCTGVLDTKEFTLTYAQETTYPIGNVTDCGSVNFDFTIDYPAILNVDTRVKNDAKISVYQDAALSIPWNINAGAVISISYDGTPLTPYTVPSANDEFLLSTLVGGGAPYPLQGHSGSDVWEFSISGVTPSTYYVKIENMAVLNSIDYVYATQDFKVIKVGATGVTVDEPMGTISTVGGAPLQFEVTVTYPDLVAQNIDPSVLVDALITSNVPLNTGATVAEIKYNGSVVPLSGTIDLSGLSSIRLSEILGSAPTALLGHSNLTDVWTITLTDVIAGGCATKGPIGIEMNIQSVAFVADPWTEPCPVILGTDILNYRTNCISAQASTVAPVCDGSEITGSQFEFSYPPITGNPATITTDSKITCDVDMPAGVTIGWSYNSGAASGSYTLPDAIPAGTPLYLSTIVGSPAPTPLEGHNLLSTTWDFTFDNVPVGVYHLTVVPIASMASPLLEEVLTTDPLSITQTLTVLALPDPTITGDLTMYSGETKSFSVASTASYSWNVIGSTDVVINGSSAESTVNVKANWPFTGTFDLHVVVDNGTCDDESTITITVKPNILYGQVKYWNAQESPMPSPFNTNWNGMTVPDYFYVALISTAPDKKDGGPSFNPKDDPRVLSFQTVQPNWIEDGSTITEYLSSFMFDYNLNPTSEYRVVVWDGGYLEENLGADGYLGQTWTWNNWGGVNATDALAIQHMAAGNTLPFHWVGQSGDVPSYGFFTNKLGNVNRSFQTISPYAPTITALDALITSRRAVGYIPTFTNNKPNFEVAGKLVPFADFNTNNTFTNSLSATPSTRPDIEFYNDYYDYNWSTFALDHVYGTDGNVFEAGENFLNIYYSAVGDINASYVPEYGGFKAKPAMELTVDNQLEVSKGEIVDIPVRLESGADLGAITLGINYRNDLIEVVGVNYSEDFARIDAEKGNVQIAWFNTDGQHFNANDAIATFKVRVLADIDANTPLFELQNAEIADNSATVIEGNNLKTVALVTNLNANSTELRAENYPNPFNEKTTISYNLPETGNVQLVIYNKMGQIVKTVVNGIQQAGLQTIELNRSDLMSGVYYYRITLHGVSSDYSVTKNMIVVQ